MDQERKVLIANLISLREVELSSYEIQWEGTDTPLSSIPDKVYLVLRPCGRKQENQRRYGQ